MTGDEKRLMAKHGLTLEQINWRRIEIRRSERGEGLFLQEYPEDPLEAFITSGDTYFDQEAMREYLRLVKKPLHV